jgi:hypothetical protein
LGDDLREVRRQMDHSKPAAALKAMTSPVSRPVVKDLVDTDTIPVSPGKGHDDTKPLSLNKTFDSFDATMRLAAMTDQVDDFKEYITATQKMRAYKGKIEPGSPLAPKAPAQAPAAAPAPAPVAKPAPAEKPAPRPVPIANPSMQSSGAASSGNLLAVAAIAVLSLAAIGLIIALLLK